MRIGLVTWIGMGNFGTTLQSFALCRKLQMMGHNVYFPMQCIPSNPIKELIKRFLYFFGYAEFKRMHRYATANPYNGLKLYRFIHKYYKIKDSYSVKKLESTVNDTDLFITGSDQIWNVKYKFTPFMFLNFAKDKKRIAYASSIGLSYIPKEYEEQVKELINKFSYIGVREQTAVDVLSKLTGRSDIIQVLDPTFLLTSEEWSELCEDATYEIELPKKYILCYLIANNSWYKEQLQDVVAKTGIKNVIIIPSAENPNVEMENSIIYRYASPIEFVDLIRRASFICTDSFHATAISINLHKNFVDFLRFKKSDKASQNSRIYDVLSHYRLMNRIYSNETTEWSLDIDFTYSSKLLAGDRIFSLNYLVNAIENKFVL